MANFFLIRSAAAGTIAAGVAVLCWFNRLSREDQEAAEQVARDRARSLVEMARERIEAGDRLGPSIR